MSVETTERTYPGDKLRRHREPRGVPPRRAVVCRPFTLSDAMALLAATAVGLALVCGLMEVPQLRSGTLRRMGLAAPLAAAWALTLLGLRLRRPRPSLRRLARQPGTAAGIMVLVALPVAAGWLLAARTIDSFENLPPLILGRDGYPSFERLTTTIGPLVLGAWLILALCGLRRPEPGWIDRLGRLLGAYWIVLSLVICGGEVVHCRNRLARQARQYAPPEPAPPPPPLPPDWFVERPSAGSEPLQSPRAPRLRP